MIDQYMIPPGNINEYKWLSENLSQVTSLYDNQRKLAAESEKRLLSPKRRLDTR